MHRSLSTGTRQWEIVTLVAREGPMTLADLAEEIGLAKTSMRQQVDRLLAEGWLDRARRQGKRGRPVDLFSLSDQSRRLFAGRVDAFARSLLHEIRDAEGESALRDLVKRIGRRMTTALQSRIGEGTPEERVRRLAELLAESGALNDLAATERGLTLTVHTCPYHGLAEERGALCEMEREMVSRIAGAKARLKRRMPDGHGCCEFEVAVRPGESA